MNKIEQGCSIFPLRDVLRILNFRKYPFTVLFYVFTLIIYFLLVVMPYSPAIQDALMRKFHVRKTPYVLWALSQVVPNMYNFGNEIWVSTSQLTPADIESKGLPSSIVLHQMVNHYPLRALYFSLHRETFTADHYFVYIRSRYQDNTFVSVFDMERDGNGWRIDPVENEAQVE